LIARHSHQTPTTQHISNNTKTQTNNNNRANKHNKVPETKNIEEGSSRRNIIRKHDHDTHKKVKKQGGGSGVGGKGQWNELDDGSLL
jgi:hypothetical protein